MLFLWNVTKDYLIYFSSGYLESCARTFMLLFVCCCCLWLNCIRLEKGGNWHMMKQRSLLGHLNSVRRQRVMPWLLYLKHLLLILIQSLIGNVYSIVGKWKLTFVFYSNFICIIKCVLLSRELMNEILEKGHSRVPVYYEQPTNIIGLVLVKLFPFFLFKPLMLNIHFPLDEKLL